MDKSSYKKEYIKRIHTVQDYIETNIHENYTIEELSKISGFSKYHFHRIFKSIQKESLFQYVTRVKLEIAATALIARPDLSITDIAYQFGFSDSAVFSRTFKNYYGISPREFKQQYSNNCKDSFKKTIYTKSIDSHNQVKGEVKVTTIDAFPVIYIRRTGSYKDLEGAYPDVLNQLFEFAMKKNLIDEESLKIFSAYHSHPDFSGEETQRTSICLSIKEPINIDDESEIGTMSIMPGTYAVAHFEISRNEYGGAWEYLYGEWLPQSGYFPTDYFPFEVYLNDPIQHPLHKHLVDIYLPIEPSF